VARRSPILGYNHNVRFRGIVFHVQTEDSGIVNPHVFSHLFHGGVILSTRKLVYDPDATEDVVKALMQAQHKAVLKDLRRGLFDDKIDLYLGSTPGLLPREANGEAGDAPTTVPDAAPLAPPAPPAEALPLAPVQAADGPVAPPPPPSFALEPAIPPPSFALEPAIPPPSFALEPAIAPARVGLESPAITLEPSLEPPALDLAELSAIARAPSIQPPALVLEEPAPLLPASPLPTFPPAAAASVDTLRIARRTEPPGALASAVPVAMEAIDSEPVVISMSREPTAPAIELIEALEPDLPPPSLALGEDEAAFESVTARTQPPHGVVDETERVPTVVDEEPLSLLSVADAEPLSLADAVPLSVADAEPLSLDNAELVEPILPLPRRVPSVPPPVPPRRTAPLRTHHATDPAPAGPPVPASPQPLRIGEALFAAPSDEDAVHIEAARPRTETNRSQPISPVRVSFVSARGPTPPNEQAPGAPPSVPSLPPVLDVVPLDARETPPSANAAFDDGLPPPLPPPPPLPGRAELPLVATPAFGVPSRSTPRTSGLDTVPRLAGVPAPTPPLSTPLPPLGGPTLAPLSPPLAIATTAARVPSEPLAHASMAAIGDDDLHAAGLVESGDVAEIHAPPLPSATAPPGAAPERPGQYHVNTRVRPEVAASSRPPGATRPPAPQRAAAGPTRPQPGSTSSPVNTTFRASPPPPSPAPARPPSQRPGTKPPTNTTPPPRAEPVRAEPVRAEPARAEPARAEPVRTETPSRPAPRPRPTTGAGVVVSRPAVIVGAPARPAGPPAPPPRARRARDGARDGLITERSLDEVILAYLSEDGNEE
jgi:hypothetical protein